MCCRVPDPPTFLVDVENLGVARGQGYVVYRLDNCMHILVLVLVFKGAHQDDDMGLLPVTGKLT